MWLRNGDHSVLVSPQGGSILQWQYKEHVILGPARMVRVGDELKARGETHWCYPNFGTPPSAYSLLGKHGTLRHEILGPNIMGGKQVDMYSGWRHQPAHLCVAVEVSPEGVRHTLSSKNPYRERTPILPALHPYFAVPPDGFSLIVGNNNPIRGKDIPSNDHLTEDMVIKRCGLPVYVYLHGIGRVQLKTSDGCSHFVIWSDQPASYVCVEPIFGKPGTFGTPQGRWLEPGALVKCNVRLDFEKIK